MPESPPRLPELGPMQDTSGLYRTCPVCRGAGFTIYDSEAYSMPLTHKCDFCQGTGRVRIKADPY